MSNRRPSGLRAPSKQTERQQLHDSWAKFLRNRNFQAWATLTFKHQSVTPHRALAIFKNWIHASNRKMFGSRYFNRAAEHLSWAVSIEAGTKKLHLHVLLTVKGKNLSREELNSMENLWNRKHGIAKVEMVQFAEAVSAYLTKVTAFNGEIELSKNFK
ncbi:hypothetical protein [Stenotrophobium rhamnosiphilum]|uniref:hypothetical protein n=1 Tax=Stenotrophobium rhamnosiphilum TaxID=2029166 RepID=UPI0011B1E9A0|nr:hypothetical protein [Stenotrophobium rhamnosiphilum]